MNRDHPTFPRQVVLAGAEIQVGAPLGVGAGNLPSHLEAAALLPNVPNPFNPATTLRFELAARAPVTLLIRDATGRRIWNRSWDELSPGRHELLWPGVDAAGAPVGSGTYFLRLAAGREVHSRKLSLIR